MTALDRSYDGIIIGAGHHGMVLGTYLAKAGLSTLILERRHLVGGAAITETYPPEVNGVARTVSFMAEGLREIMAELGFRTLLEMVGRVDCLQTDQAIRHWKADGLDLTPILTPARGRVHCRLFMTVGTVAS